MDRYNYKGRNIYVHGFRFKKNATPRFDADRDELRRSPPSDYRYVDFYFISHIMRQMFFLPTYVTTLIRYFATLAYFLKSDAA